jgi:hypothetical protein
MPTHVPFWGACPPGKEQKNGGIRRKGAQFFVALFILLGNGAPALSSAAVLEYQASTSGTATVAMAPGETKTITLAYKNIGSKTWVAGKDKTALFIYGDSSLFGNSSWLANDMPALLSPSMVKSGEMARISFKVHAPSKAGTYTQAFLLSYAKNSWLKGSKVVVTFNVNASAVAAPVVVPVVAPIPTPTPTVSSNVPDSTEWTAQLTDRGGIEWQADPGGHLIINIAFKNSGTKTWTSEGKSYVSLYTGKGKRVSGFKDFSWKNDYQVALLKEREVRPGQVGHFTVELRAPTKPGAYQESFQLAAEDTAWVGGGVVTFPIRVTSSLESIAQGADSDRPIELAAAPNGNYRAALLLKSVQKIELTGNARQQVTYGFKNEGTATWNNVSLRLASILPMISPKVSNVRDESWPTTSEPVKMNAATAPGQIGFFTFKLKVPAKKGNYTAKFSLLADGQNVEQGEIEIPITVTADGYIEPDPTPTTTPSPTPTPITPTPSGSSGSVLVSGDPANLPAEPIIRVGLFKTTDDQMRVRSIMGGFTLQQNGNTVCTFSQGQEVLVTYNRSSAVYTASGANCTTQSSGYYVAVPSDGISPLELTDYSRPVSWLPGANDNKFRGKLELRFTPKTDSVWIINELPVEWYLKGIGETSNSSPQQYQRALLTAARTYAMYHVQRGTKHANEYYIVDAKYDQVYRGYGAEIRDPNVVTAIDATRGQIVTYQGKLAITPYYSRSDGRTRSWSEVWNGSYGWLVSVPVPWDNGRTLWGHGVGMSATGALGMAADGWDYMRILKYFYTGIELQQIYK